MIVHIQGDATKPVGEGPAVIAHICNNVGVWGAGFVLALSKAFGQRPKREYMKWYNQQDELGRDLLGRIQILLVDQRPIYVCNMVAQKGINRLGGGRLVSYDALDLCLHSLSLQMPYEEATIHMPLIGCGIGGGKWEVVEALIRTHLSKSPVYVYHVPTTMEFPNG